MTKSLMLSAAAAAFLLAGGGAWAQESSTDPANCGLNAKQVSAGWTCTAETTVDNISRTIGNGSRCQDATTTTSTYRGYNPAGNLGGEEKVIVSEPEDSDWGSSYPIGDGCNH